MCVRMMKKSRNPGARTGKGKACRLWGHSLWGPVSMEREPALPSFQSDLCSLLHWSQKIILVTGGYQEPELETGQTQMPSWRLDGKGPQSLAKGPGLLS
jgi:hypothetical protein